MGSVTIGYKYFVGMHMALCHGPVDSLHRIRVNEKVVWEGENTGGAITIDKASIFGGDKREGGISGTLDFEQGGPAQTANDYLVGQLGASTPAFRGVCAAVLRHMYLGTSGYLKPWDFLMQRVNTLASGEAQWYPEKAAIPVCAEPAAGLGDGWAILPGENDGTGGGGGGDGGDGGGGGGDDTRGYFLLVTWNDPQFAGSYFEGTARVTAPYVDQPLVGYAAVSDESVETDLGLIVKHAADYADMLYDFGTEEQPRWEMAVLIYLDQAEADYPGDAVEIDLTYRLYGPAYEPSFPTTITVQLVRATSVAVGPIVVTPPWEPDVSRLATFSGDAEVVQTSTISNEFTWEDFTGYPDLVGAPVGHVSFDQTTKTFSVS